MGVRALLFALVLVAAVSATPDRTTSFSVLPGDTFTINHWVAGLFDSEFSMTLDCANIAAWRLSKGASMSSLSEVAQGACQPGTQVTVGTTDVADAVDVVLELACPNITSTVACTGNSTIKNEGTMGNLRSGALFFALTIVMSIVFVVILLTIYAGAVQGFTPMPTSKEAWLVSGVATEGTGITIESAGGESNSMFAVEDKVWIIFGHIVAALVLLPVSFFPGLFALSIVAALLMLNAFIVIWHIWWRELWACCPCRRRSERPWWHSAPLAPRADRLRAAALLEQNSGLLREMRCVIPVLGILAVVSIALGLVFLLPGLVAANVLFVVIAGVYACRILVALSMWGPVGQSMDRKPPPTPPSPTEVKGAVGGGCATQ